MHLTPRCSTTKHLRLRRKGPRDFQGRSPCDYLTDKATSPGPTTDAIQLTFCLVPALYSPPLLPQFPSAPGGPSPSPLPHTLPAKYRVQFLTGGGAEGCSVVSLRLIVLNWTGMTMSWDQARVWGTRGEGGRWGDPSVFWTHWEALSVLAALYDPARSVPTRGP